MKLERETSFCICSLDGVRVLNWKQNSRVWTVAQCSEHLPSMCEEAWGSISITPQKNKQRANTTTVKPLTCSLDGPELEMEGMFHSSSVCCESHCWKDKQEDKIHLAVVFRIYSKQGGYLGEVYDSWSIFDLVMS